MVAVPLAATFTVVDPWLEANVALPLYTAMMFCEPVALNDVVSVAWPDAIAELPRRAPVIVRLALLPLMGPMPRIAFVFWSMNATWPLRLATWIFVRVAVRVTLAPGANGLAGVWLSVTLVGATGANAMPRSPMEA